MDSSEWANLKIKSEPTEEDFNLSEAGHFGQNWLPYEIKTEDKNHSLDSSSQDNVHTEVVNAACEESCVKQNRMKSNSQKLLNYEFEPVREASKIVVYKPDWLQIQPKEEKEDNLSGSPSHDATNMSLEDEDSQKPQIEHGSDSQPPHSERDDEQRQRKRKKSRRKALLLDDDTQEQLIEWVREHELLWRKGATDYKDTKKKTELWARKARDLGIEGGTEALKTWWKSARDLYAKLLSKKSGQAAANLTDRELFIQRTCAFLHKEVKPRKDQPLRSIPLTQEPAASQTSDFSSQPPLAQPSGSANTSQEEDEGSLSLIESQAASTRSQGTPTPPAPSSTATRAEPEDSPAMLEMRDSMKATNALMQRLVQAQEISYARQPFITYMSQSLQRLPEAQYQLAVERMTATLHEIQRPIPRPLLPAPPRPASALSPTPTFYQQQQHHDFQQQPQHFQQLQTPRVSQLPSSTPRSSNE